MIRLSEEVDVELQTSAFDVCAREDAIAPPVHDCSPWSRLGLTASLDELLEAAKQRNALGILPLKI
jgi:hypothetical protein